jgi:hypothetical protein
MALGRKSRGRTAATGAKGTAKGVGKGVGRALLTPGGAKNALGVAKVLGPAVVPLVAPYALRAAGVARDGLDRYRARRLGVDVTQLAEFTGRGGALHARLVGADQALADLEGRDGGTEEDRAFAASARQTLASLAAAVRAAERMPTARRKAAWRSVGGELDPIEQELLRRLGI